MSTDLFSSKSHSVAKIEFVVDKSLMPGTIDLFEQTGQPLPNFLFTVFAFQL
jgi:hypothetical protein